LDFLWFCIILSVLAYFLLICVRCWDLRRTASFIHSVNVYKVRSLQNPLVHDEAKPFLIVYVQTKYEI
jgi:hypothetical protein